MCNPNAGLYECHHYQSSWLDFYLGRGHDACVYNYRGYGRSEGWPSPAANNSDGEDILATLRTLGYEKFLVHAESIGGITGVHLSSLPEGLGVDVLVADRTFGDLPTVANFLVGAWAKKAVRWVVGWEAANSGKYFEK